MDENQFLSASFLADNRVVFNIGGNKYRLFVWVNYDAGSIFLEFIGTHAEYAKIDAEAIHYPIGEPDPIAAITKRMGELGLKQKDLADILGSASRVSEILNRKRKPTVPMILKLHERLGLPLETLVRAAA